MKTRMSAVNPIEKSAPERSALCDSPPHVRIIRDKPVVYGDDAAFRAQVLQALAVRLLILCMLLMLWYVAATLNGGTT